MKNYYGIIMKTVKTMIFINKIKIYYKKMPTEIFNLKPTCLYLMPVNRYMTGT